jgi:hypothetical protein
MRISRRARHLGFGVAVAGALVFGGAQALASLPSRDGCDNPGEIYVGTCPGLQCGSLCASGVGVCKGGCCSCKYEF